jgi:hemolysin III
MEEAHHTRDPALAKLYSLGEEAAHAVTHGLGLLLSLGGLATLVAAASLRGDVASTLYHATPGSRAKGVFQRLDHAAIFLLIAGTYTPFTLVTLRGGWGWTLLALVWTLAILGIVLQVTVPSWARRFSVPLYLAMGWLGVLVAEPLARSVHPDGLALLVLGGVTYTLGVIFYAWQRLPYNHAVWHIFVMAGSVCHFSCVLGYVIPPAA